MSALAVVMSVLAGLAGSVQVAIMGKLGGRLIASGYRTDERFA